MAEKEPDDADVVLVGAGIMSMTLATFLKELQPHLRLEIIERLPGEAQESSHYLLRDCDFNLHLHRDHRAYA